MLRISIPSQNTVDTYIVIYEKFTFLIERIAVKMFFFFKAVLLSKYLACVSGSKKYSFDPNFLSLAPEKSFKNNGSTFTKLKIRFLRFLPLTSRW